MMKPIPTAVTQRTSGFLLGKFMPPTDGHKYLGDFAQSYCDDLFIMVESNDEQPIDGFLRAQWMREIFPNATIIHCHEKLPQDPSETPDFWAIWMDVLARYTPLNIDFVFASEPYGHKIAEILGAQFIPVDIARTCRPISATMIRSNPYAYWHMLPEPVRAHYCQRIVLVGPESSGKSTLAARLADKLQTIMAPEYGRLYCDQFGQPDQNGLRLIAKGHAAGVAAAKRQANRVLIEDTDAMMTQIWADMLGEDRDPEIEAHWNAPDLYVLCNIDIPWVDDGQRWFPGLDQRNHFLNLCRDELNRRNVPWVMASGTIEQRIKVVLNAIRLKMPEIS